MNDSVISYVDLKRLSSRDQSQSIRFPGALPPLSIYIHIPWCVRKCPYCDFNSHKLTGELPERQFLDALSAEIEQWLPLVWGRKIYSVFIGGGTPSLLSAKAMDELLMLLRSLFAVAAGTEITMEANPGTAEAERFAAYAESGINRLSLGIQSFDDQKLAALGRIHNSKQAREAIEIAQKHFANINLDLMYALPEQSLQDLEQDLTTAIGFGTRHLSVYNLTLEPNTVFAKYPPANIPDDETTENMLEIISDLASQAGFSNYEVSAYAQPNSQCRHNLNYWRFGDYLGLGPGAHGKVSFPDKIIRTANLRSPDSWMKAAVLRDGSHQSENRELDAGDVPFEFMLNVLRLREGVESNLYQAHTGLQPISLNKTVEKAVEQGLMDPDPLVYRANERGWRFLNDLQMLFL